MRITTFIVLAAIAAVTSTAATGCVLSTSNPTLECPTDKHLGYTKAGCGQAAEATCLWNVYDSCARSFCSCDGETVTGCEGSSVAFSAEGACIATDKDAGPSSDAAADASPDALAAAPVDAPVDAPTLAITCPKGKHAGYKTIGCGQSALPTCLWDVWDACAKSYCSCDAKTVFGCEGSPVAFSAEGACITTDIDAGPPSKTAVDAAPDVLVDAPVDAPATNITCPKGKHAGYKTVGCGQSALPTCLWDVWDACAKSYCSCDAKTVFGCEGSDVPYASAGACP